MNTRPAAVAALFRNVSHYSDVLPRQDHQAISSGTFFLPPTSLLEAFLHRYQHRSPNIRSRKHSNARFFRRQLISGFVAISAAVLHRIQELITRSPQANRQQHGTGELPITVLISCSAGRWCLRQFQHRKQTIIFIST